MIVLSTKILDKVERCMKPLSLPLGQPKKQVDPPKTNVVEQTDLEEDNADIDEGPRPNKESRDTPNKRGALADKIQDTLVNRGRAQRRPPVARASIEPNLASPER